MSGGATFSVRFGKVHAIGGNRLVHFGKVHAVGKLQAGDLPRVVLNFQVRRHQRNVH